GWESRAAFAGPAGADYHSLLRGTCDLGESQREIRRPPRTVSGSFLLWALRERVERQVRRAEMATEGSDRVLIFYTTLRDGEQSPGCSMNLQEKLKVALALRDLGVDIIEAGFPIASPGDFEAIKIVSPDVQGPIIAGLARCNRADIDKAGEALKDAPRKRIHVF